MNRTSPSALPGGVGSGRIIATEFAAANTISYARICRPGLAIRAKIRVAATSSTGPEKQHMVAMIHRSQQPARDAWCAAISEPEPGMFLPAMEVLRCDPTGGNSDAYANNEHFADRGARHVRRSDRARRRQTVRARNTAGRGADHGHR